MNDNIKCMLKTAKKHSVNFVAIKMTPHLLAQLPTWYHLSADNKPLNNARAKCLLQKHNVTKVADLVRTSAHLCHPTQHPTHRKNRNCTCQECRNDRSTGCKNPHKCAAEALARLNLIPPKHNPTRQDPPDGMSLTRTRKLRNERAKQDNGEILFDLSITCKESVMVRSPCLSVDCVLGFLREVIPKKEVDHVKCHVVCQGSQSREMSRDLSEIK